MKLNTKISFNISVCSFIRFKEWFCITMFPLSNHSIVAFNSMKIKKKNKKIHLKLKSLNTSSPLNMRKICNKQKKNSAKNYCHYKNSFMLFYCLTDLFCFWMKSFLNELHVSSFILFALLSFFHASKSPVNYSACDFFFFYLMSCLLILLWISIPNEVKTIQRRWWW